MSDSEYFLYIDYKRERVEERRGKAFNRSSVFCAQELAVAKYLNLEVLPFQQVGVRREGIVSSIALNPIKFKTKKGLTEKIIKEVAHRWKHGWKNQLFLENSKNSPADAVVRSNSGERPGLWYHVAVENHHRDRMAHHCVGYIEKIIAPDGSNITRDILIEQKWRAVMSESATIPASRTRDLDGVHIFQDQPTIAYPGINGFIADSEELLYTLKGPGKFEISFVVFSDDFKPARDTFILDIDSDFRKTRFYKKSTPPPPPPSPYRLSSEQFVSYVPTSGTSSVLVTGVITDIPIGTLNPIFGSGQQK